MNTAYVKIWGELVGAVAWSETDGIATFEYNPQFKTKGWDLSPLQMSIYETKSSFSFPALRKKSDPNFDTFKGLPGLLADVLPDRYGNELINLWLAQQGRPLNSMNPVEMLCFIGTRGIGAVEFEPTSLKESKRTFSVEMDSLVDIAQRCYRKKNLLLPILKPTKKRLLWKF
jgi:serine/threonine-protein kinase HipA